MSLASVLVISEKVGRWPRKVRTSAFAAALRVSSSVSCSRLSVGSSDSSSPSTSKRSAAIVSSNSRFQAPRPVTAFSWKSCSSLSSSW